MAHATRRMRLRRVGTVFGCSARAPVSRPRPQTRTPTRPAAALAWWPERTAEAATIQMSHHRVFGVSGGCECTRIGPTYRAITASKLRRRRVRVLCMVAALLSRCLHHTVLCPFVRAGAWSTMSAGRDASGRFLPRQVRTASRRPALYGASCSLPVLAPDRFPYSFVRRRPPPIAPLRPPPLLHLLLQHPSPIAPLRPPPLLHLLLQHPLPCPPLRPSSITTVGRRGRSATRSPIRRPPHSVSVRMGPRRTRWKTERS